MMLIASPILTAVSAKLTVLANLEWV